MCTSSQSHAQPASHRFWLLPELLRYIHTSLPQRDFAALCLASRANYNSANRILYEDVSLSLEGAAGLRALNTLYESLVASSGLARFVKTLRIRVRGLEKKQSEEPTHLATLSNIVRLCPELRELHILDCVPSATPALLDLGSSLDSATSLSHLTFECQNTRWPIRNPGEESVNEIILIHILKHSTIKSTTLTVHEGPEGLLRNAMLPVSNTITRLCLNEAYIGTGTLRNILLAMPQLQHLALALLRYADPTRKHVGPRLDFEELGNALVACSTMLESLKLAIKYEARTALDVPAGGGKRSAWGPFGSVTSLRAYQKLKSLELAPEVLLGWHGEHSKMLSETLPDSLEQLIFRWDFGGWYNTAWDFSSYCEKTQEYLNSSHRAPLKNLTMSCFDYEVEDAETELDTIRHLCDGFDISFSLDALED